MVDYKEIIQSDKLMALMTRNFDIDIDPEIIKKLEVERQT